MYEGCFEAALEELDNHRSNVQNFPTTMDLQPEASQDSLPLPQYRSHSEAGKIERIFDVADLVCLDLDRRIDRNLSFCVGGECLEG